MLKTSSCKRSWRRLELLLLLTGLAGATACTSHNKITPETCIEPTRAVTQAADDATSSTPPDAREELFGTYAELTRQEISFTSRGARLRAIITAPKGDASFERPAALILHDHGPRSADGFIDREFGVKYPQDVPIYRQLARALASRGFVVMTFDKRTCVSGASAYCNAPRENLASQQDQLTAALLDDARAALVKLEGEPRTDRDKILLVGHGQGAQLAAAIARDTATVRGVVALAPSASSLDHVITSQLARTQQTIEAKIAAAPDTALTDRLTEELAKLKATSAEQTRAFSALRADANYSEEIANVPPATWRALFALHENAMAFYRASDRGPLLVLTNELDAVLPPDNARALAETLPRKEGREDRLEVIPDTTHNLIDLGGDHATGMTIHPDIATHIIEFSASIMSP